MILAILHNLPYTALFKHDFRQYLSSQVLNYAGKFPLSIFTGGFEHN
jgi:hypothetical protein